MEFLKFALWARDIVVAVLLVGLGALLSGYLR